MSEKDPFEDILNQIGDLLTFARDKSSEAFVDKMPEGIGTRLSYVEDMVEALKKVSEEEVKEKGMTRKDVLDKLFDERKQLPRRDQKIIEHTIHLSKDAIGMRFALQAAEMKAQSLTDKPFDTQKVKEGQVNKRKSKFKKMRGDDRWKKL